MRVFSFHYDLLVRINKTTIIAHCDHLIMRNYGSAAQIGNISHVDFYCTFCERLLILYCCQTPYFPMHALAQYRVLQISGHGTFFSSFHNMERHLKVSFRRWNNLRQQVHVLHIWKKRHCMLLLPTTYCLARSKMWKFF